jgi:two-component system heavy metal sensor histidine kinase CusS
MIFVGLAISTSMIFISILVLEAVKSHFVEQDTEELHVITQAINTRLINASENGLNLRNELAQSISGHHGIIFQVWDTNNQLIYGTIEYNLTEKQFSSDMYEFNNQTKLHSWSHEHSTYRGIITSTQVESDVFYVVAAISMDFHIEFLGGFQDSLIIIMGLAGVFTLLATWFGIYQGHSPLRELSKTLQSVKADRLNVRLDPEIVPEELRQLVESFNKMISHLEESFIKLSNFSSDIAHELRTPLTNLITQTQVGLSKSRSQNEYLELLYSNLEEHERLAKMVNEMLWLAQSDNGLVKPVLQKIDLCTEISTTIDYFEVVADDKKIQLISDCQPTKLMCDQSMIRRVLSNLLSNALRFTPTHGEIRISSRNSDDGNIILTVENQGADIPEEHLNNLFDRFYQVDASRQRQSEGAGLGLAIVKSIVEAHNGKITVTSRNGITSFAIILPSTT